MSHQPDTRGGEACRQECTGGRRKGAQGPKQSWSLSLKQAFTPTPTLSNAGSQTNPNLNSGLCYLLMVQPSVAHSRNSVSETSKCGHRRVTK